MYSASGEVLRELSPRGREDWDALERTRFFRRALEDGRIVATEELEPGLLRHERLPFVSYPYEWPFEMLRDAALLQLSLLDEALAEGFVLKDGSPYNVQWRGSQPVFVDVGSFERLREGEPWAGYRQFCALFLYPLMLQAYRGVAPQPLLRGSLEGIEPSQARALAAALPPRRADARRPARPARGQARRPAARRPLRAEGGRVQEGADPGERAAAAEARLAPRAEARPLRVGRLPRGGALQRRGRRAQGALRPRRRLREARLGPGRERRALLARARRRVRARRRRGRAGRRRALRRPARGRLEDDPAARGRPGRRLAGPRLARARAAAARGARPARPRALPGARPPPGDRPQRPLRGARRLAARARRRGW